MEFETVTWENNHVILLDQKRLPGETIYHSYHDPEYVAAAIENMVVRGAPAIGVTAALGLALAATKSISQTLPQARIQFAHWCERFAKTRPTAINLFWAIERMKKCSDRTYADTAQWSQALVVEAVNTKDEDIAACKRMGEFGEKLFPQEGTILTHCNAGALATAGWGTALGVIRSAVKNGKKLHVFADETRPFMQGSRLTAWELQQSGIPVTILTDNMAGYFMAKEEIDAVIVGADRIAANGDTANKIGTYSLAILAKAHNIPFYVAAPLSTFDMTCETGKQIPIEERKASEVFEFAGTNVAPKGVLARNPAFDVTPASYITAIITEAGVCQAPYAERLKQLFSENKARSEHV